MTFARLMAAAGRPHPRRGGAGRPLPVRAWPDDAALWLDENGTRRPQRARQALAALAALGLRGRFGARTEGAGRIVTGPASVLALRDGPAEIGFVFSLTLYGYGQAPF